MTPVTPVDAAGWQHLHRAQSGPGLHCKWPSAVPTLRPFPCHRVAAVNSYAYPALLHTCPPSSAIPHHTLAEHVATPTLPLTP